MYLTNNTFTFVIKIAAYMQLIASSPSSSLHWIRSNQGGDSRMWRSELFDSDEDADGVEMWIL